MSNEHTIQDTYEEVFRREKPKQIEIKIGNRTLSIFISDLIIILAAIATFITGFFPPLTFIGFAFSVGLILTLVIRLNVMKLIALILIASSYLIILFTSFYISATDVFLLLVGINSIGKWISYLGSSIMIIIYLVGLVGGIKEFNEKSLLLASFVILGVSIGSAIVELVGNLFVFHHVDPLFLTSQFILQITGFFIAFMVAFSMAFLLMYGIKKTWGKISND